MMREAIRTERLTVPIIGSWASAQIRAEMASTHFVFTWLTRKPTRTAEIENKTKKVLPIPPNSVFVNLSSVMMGTAASPMTALSAKLMSMKQNIMPTTIQAFRSLVRAFIRASIFSLFLVFSVLRMRGAG